jgi:hypothetical protein
VPSLNRDSMNARTSDLSIFIFHADYATAPHQNLVLTITEGESIKMTMPHPEWKNKNEFYSWLADRMEEAGIYLVQVVPDEEKYHQDHKQIALCEGP